MIRKTQIHKIAVAACAAVLTMSTLCACQPRVYEPPCEYESLLTFPFTSEEADAVLFQPGTVSAYGQNAGARPEVHIWYDNADTSTNVCMDFYDLDREETKAAVNQKIQYVQELYSRIINTAKEYAGGDRYFLYTLSGQHLVDFDNAANNNVVWGPAQPGLNPGNPDFYVRSIEMGITEADGNKSLRNHPADYAVMSKGVLHQLYDADGMITQDAFTDQLNVVFTDAADSDMTATDLANLVAGRLTDARAAGKDVSFQVVGVKVPFCGVVSLPGSDKNTMHTYNMTQSPNLKLHTFYFLISGPTAATEQYTSNLTVSLKGKVNIDTSNEDGFKPECLFVTDAAAEPAAEGEETEAVQASSLIRVIPDEEAETNAKEKGKSKAKKQKKNSDAETSADEADTTDTATDTAATDAPAAESDYRTANFVTATEEQMLACFRSSDIGDLAKYAEQQKLNWKQYMSLVYLPTTTVTNKKMYPAELLTQLNDTEKSEIKEAKLYQAYLIKGDKNKVQDCIWRSVSKEDFNSYGEFIQLKNEVYLKLNKQAPQDTHLWMLEIDLMDRVTEDHSGMISEKFTEEYMVADLKNGAYNTYLARGDFGDIILSANDQKVREKYYVVIMPVLKPLDTMNEVNAKKNGIIGSSDGDSKEESKADKKSGKQDSADADGE